MVFFRDAEVSMALPALQYSTVTHILGTWEWKGTVELDWEDMRFRYWIPQVGLQSEKSSGSYS